MKPDHWKIVYHLEVDQTKATGTIFSRIWAWNNKPFHTPLRIGQRHERFVDSLHRGIIAPEIRPFGAPLNMSNRIPGAACEGNRQENRGTPRILNVLSSIIQGSVRYQYWDASAPI